MNGAARWFPIRAERQRRCAVHHSLAQLDVYPKARSGPTELTPRGPPQMGRLRSAPSTPTHCARPQVPGVRSLSRPREPPLALGFWAFSAGFVFKTTPTVSKTLESVGKSGGKFVGENRWGLVKTVRSHHDVLRRRRGGEVGVGPERSIDGGGRLGIRWRHQGICLIAVARMRARSAQVCHRGGGVALCACQP
jgi:hypothetical protein